MSCNAKKDPNGTWRIQYRWTDWTGTKKKSQKKGFKTKKEAVECYAHFMLQQSSDPTMTLADFWEIYKADMEKRLRKTTMKQKEYVMNDKVLPYFGKIADRILIMKNGELIQEGTEKKITDKVEGCVWKCIVSEKEAGQITSSFIVSNMRSSGENVELRIVSERQPVVGAENVESTQEDAYLYHTQITGGEKMRLYKML